MKKDAKPLRNSSTVDVKIQNSERYISQDNYRKEMLNKIGPYLMGRLKKGYILGVNNLNIYYEKFTVENSVGSIVICHGFGEFTEKYYELIYYFMNEGYSVFISEHRGHGRSGRLGIDEYQINVENFNYYVDDFKKFIDEIVIPNSNGKNLLLFAHSMGGAIGTIFLEKYNNYFKAAVLSSPMHEINTGKVPKMVASFISKSMKLCGKGVNYLPGQLPYRGEKKFPSRATSCRERYDYMYEKIKGNNYYHTGGPSALWFAESIKATKKLIRKENASKVKIPIVLFQAEYDTHVIPKAQNKFASNAENCEVVKVKGGKHESYFERDEIAFEFLNKVLSFYQKNVK